MFCVFVRFLLQVFAHSNIFFLIFFFFITEFQFFFLIFSFDTEMHFVLLFFLSLVSVCVPCRVFFFSATCCAGKLIMKNGTKRKWLESRYVTISRIVDVKSRPFSSTTSDWMKLVRKKFYCFMIVCRAICVSRVEADKKRNEKWKECF